MTLRTSYFEQVVVLMRSWGFTFHEVAGCRSRDNGGTFNPTHFVEHHDASSRLSGVNGALAVVIAGRPGIEGMLSQFFANRKGEGFWVGSGQAWHAGVGGPTRGVPANAANQAAVGLEVANDGVGEAYSPELDRFIVHLEAACMIVAKRTAENVFGHKEWTDRKSDPRKNMDVRRASVASIITNGAASGGQIGDDMYDQAARDELIGRIDQYNWAINQRLDKPYFFRLFRNKDTDAIALGCPGVWWVNPNPAYVELNKALSLCSGFVEDQPGNVYDFIRMQMLSAAPTAFDAEAFAERVAEILPPAQAAQVNNEILGEIKKLQDAMQADRDRLAAAASASAAELAK